MGGPSTTGVYDDAFRRAFARRGPGGQGDGRRSAVPGCLCGAMVARLCIPRVSFRRRPAFVYHPRYEASPDRISVPDCGHARVRSSASGVTSRCGSQADLRVRDSRTGWRASRSWRRRTRSTAHRPDTRRHVLGERTERADSSWRSGLANRARRRLERARYPLHARNRQR